MKIQILLKTGLLAGAIAAILNVIIYLISKRMGILNDSVLLPGGQPLTLFPVATSTLIMGIIAGLVLYLFSKIFKNPLKIFTVTGVIVLLLSGVGPLVTPNIPGNMVTILELMHLVAGTIIIYYLTRKKV